MTKTEMVKNLPSPAPAAVETMRQLEVTLTRFERTIAEAVQSLSLQTDQVAILVEPLVVLRDDLIAGLSDLASRSKKTQESAQQASQRASDASNVLAEQAQLLARASLQTKPKLWKFGAVAFLSAALAVGLQRPLLETPPPIVLDTPTIAKNIYADLIAYQQQLRQQQRQSSQ